MTDSSSNDIDLCLFDIYAQFMLSRVEHKNVLRPQRCFVFWKVPKYLKQCITCLIFMHNLCSMELSWLFGSHDKAEFLMEPREGGTIVFFQMVPVT